MVYVTYTNEDKAAINAGIFVKHIEQTHSKMHNTIIPDHTICVKAGNLKWKSSGKMLCQEARDILFSSCSDAHLRTDNKCYDPILKLYYQRPLCINENIDVSNCIANGTMCSFEGISLQSGINETDLEYINLDGYTVRCADVSQIKSLRVKIIDGQEDNDQPMYYDVLPKQVTVSVNFPIPISEITSVSRRRPLRITMTQFPINTANARTCHKLQGRTILNLFISSINYTGNWLYVCLS